MNCSGVAILLWNVALLGQRFGAKVADPIPIMILPAKLFTLPIA
jgi:hypothetical protein